MKRILKVLKYLFYAVFSLIGVVVVGLLLYYQSIYTATPFPVETATAWSWHETVPASGKPVLLPIPQKLVWTSGYFNLQNPVRFNAPAGDTAAIIKILQNHLHLAGAASTSGPVKCIKTSDLADQAYRLSVEPHQIKIEYSSLPGLFYALTTVKQLAKASDNQLPCAQIQDKPDLPIRGVMLDVSRNKVPTSETLFGLVDFLADLKYNQLQLYIEGFSFGYPSFKHLWEKTETPLMPAEIRQLDAYCKDRFIELVPNQNSLGHMAAWLATDQFKDLAECPEGYKLLGLMEMKTTISPTNPRSLELVKKMSEDLLPNFTSDKFNVNLDEPFELGKSKTRPIDDPKAVAKLYINYAGQLNDYVQRKGKTMQMWGDVVSRSPEIIPDIPGNTTLLEWGYESIHPYKTLCQQYQKAGLTYMVCPGTSSWSSFTGRTDNMLGNVENAVGNGIQYGASGMLMTDWGDFGHLQYLTVSYAGFAYAAALSWNYDSKNRIDLGHYLSQAVFNDPAGAMGDLVLELGRYNQFEEYPMVSMTTTSMSYMFGIMDKAVLDAITKKMQSGIFELLPPDEAFKTGFAERFKNPKIYHPKAILNFVDTLEQTLLRTHLNRPDSALILDEYKNAIRMIRLGAKLKQYNNYHLQQPDAVNKALLSEMKALCPAILSEHERLWLRRNKRGRLDLSSEPIKKLQVQIDDNLELLDQNAVTRWANRSLEKLKSAAAVLYLR